MRSIKVGTGIMLAAALTASSAVGALAQDDATRIAFFASSAQNGYNQAIWEGVQEVAAAAGVEAEIFDGQFNPEVELANIEDAVASGNFDGFVLLANDTVGIASSVEEAFNDHGIPTVTTLFPIGSDLSTIEPQVDGIIASVGAPPAPGAILEAEKVVEFCADKDPCNVVIMIGQLFNPFDNVRLEAFNEVLAEHDNIDIVSTVEGGYFRDTSLTVMTDVLQANPQIDAVLSNADQHLSGAEIAILDADRDLEAMYLIGGGATKEAVQAIRDGRWDATYANFPRTMGVEAAKILLANLAGEDHPSSINMDTFLDIGPIVTTQDLLDNPDFEGEWEG